MRFRTLLPALMIFTVAFVATLFSAWSQRETLITVGRDRFEVEGHALAGNIVSVMGTYANVLRSGVGLFDAKGEVMPDEFARFVKALNLEEEFPGIQGLGFSAVTNRSLHDGGTLDAPAGHIETAIRYLLPGDWRNQRAIGFDMYGETTRQVAMARARDTGEASLSGKVTLVQEVDADTQAGTLLYVPVYASPGVPDTVEERRRSLRGYVYAAFRMSDLMTRSLTAKNAEAFNNMRLQLFDGKEAVAPAQLYDSREILSTGERARVEKLPPPIFMASLPLPIAGEPWLAQMSSREPFEQKLDWSRPSVQLIGGLIISVLLAAIAASLAFARERSQQAAQLLMAEVADRKKAQEQAQLANRELIHRVKNTLAIVNAIASQTARHTRNMNEFTRAFRERLGALGRVHDLLRPDRPGNPDLRHLIMEVLAAYTPETTGALTLDGPAVPVARDDAVLLSLFMNELATNATKYGAWSTARGRVTVNWAMETQDDGQQSLLIRWHEENGPAVMPPDRVGFGTNVMRFAVERSMGGSVTLNYPKSGASHEIRLPWGRVVDPHAPFGQIPNKFS